jgi:hypothetical protein
MGLTDQRAIGHPFDERENWVGIGMTHSHNSRKNALQNKRKNKQPKNGTAPFRNNPFLMIAKEISI